MVNITGQPLASSALGNNSDSVGGFIFQATGAMSIIAMFVGIPGNILVVASVLFNRQLRTPVNFLVMGLSLCDFLFLSGIVPVQSFTFLTGWEPPDNLCWALGYLTNWFMACSVLSTGSIAINRYITIVVKSKQRQISGKKGAVIACIVVILIPFFLLCPTFDKSVGRFNYFKTMRTCSWLGDETLLMVIIVTAVILPLVVMTVCYIRIVVFVVASRKAVDAASGIPAVRAFGGTNRNEVRLTHMLALVYVVFLVTTLPSLIANILFHLGVTMPLSYYTLLYVWVWMSSAVNPIIYGLVNKKYRDAYKAVFAKMVNVSNRRTEIEFIQYNTR